MNRCDCFSWRHGVKLPGKKNGIPGGISQVPQDKWNHVSLSWYNQTAGSMTSQYLLHKTWFVCIEPEEPGRKFLQGMPPAAAPPRVGGWGGCSAKHLRSPCLDQNSVRRRKTVRVCSLQPSPNPWNEPKWLFFDNFDWWNKHEKLWQPGLQPWPQTRSGFWPRTWEIFNTSMKHFDRSRQVQFRKLGKPWNSTKPTARLTTTRGPKGDSQKPAETLLHFSLKSITSMEHRAHESSGFSDKMDPTKTVMSS